MIVMVMNWIDIIIGNSNNEISLMSLDDFFFLMHGYLNDAHQEEHCRTNESLSVCRFYVDTIDICNS